MLSVSSRIWTLVAVSISYDDNHYTTGTSQRDPPQFELLQTRNIRTTHLYIDTVDKFLTHASVITYVKHLILLSWNTYYFLETLSKDWLQHKTKINTSQSTILGASLKQVLFIAKPRTPFIFWRGDLQFISLCNRYKGLYGSSGINFPG